MRQMIYDEEGYAIGTRYDIVYEGYLFEGDKTKGLNRHEVDNWDEAIGIYNAYPDIVTIIDNEYDMHFEKGEWS